VEGDARELVRGAIEAGHVPDRAAFFESSEQAAKFISEFLTRGDLLLLKGSRGVRMEKILEAIDARHPRAVAKPAPDSIEAGRKGRS